METADQEKGRPMIKLHGKLFTCSTSVAMELIGGKWKSVILIYLTGGTKRYSELRRLIPKITERTLSLQLKQLEKDGLVSRKVYTKKPPLKVEYGLTDFGKSLEPVLRAIAEWGKLAGEERGEVVFEG